MLATLSYIAGRWSLGLGRLIWVRELLPFMEGAWILDGWMIAGYALHGELVLVYRESITRLIMRIPQYVAWFGKYNKWKWHSVVRIK